MTHRRRQLSRHAPREVRHQSVPESAVTAGSDTQSSLPAALQERAATLIPPLIAAADLVSP